MVGLRFFEGAQRSWARTAGEKSKNRLAKPIKSWGCRSRFVFVMLGRLHSLAFYANLHWTAISCEFANQIDEVVGHCFCVRADSVVAFDYQSVRHFHLIYRAVRNAVSKCVNLAPVPYGCAHGS